MDMRGQDERRFEVSIAHLERYRFSSQAHEDAQLHGDPFLSDEPDPVGDASAPATPALLGAAVGHCLSAALLEALRHAHLDVLDCRTDVTASVRPNEEGLPRIDHVEVVIRPRLAHAHPRMNRCAAVFENHCTVTSSVRAGIDVRARVEWDLDDAADDGGDMAAAELDAARD